MIQYTKFQDYTIQLHSVCKYNDWMEIERLYKQNELTGLRMQKYIRFENYCKKHPGATMKDYALEQSEFTIILSKICRIYLETYNGKYNVTNVCYESSQGFERSEHVLENINELNELINTLEKQSIEEYKSDEFKTKTFSLSTTTEKLP